MDVSHLGHASLFLSNTLKKKKKKKKERKKQHSPAGFRRSQLDTLSNFRLYIVQYGPRRLTVGTSYNQQLMAPASAIIGSAMMTRTSIMPVKIEMRNGLSGFNPGFILRPDDDGNDDNGSSAGAGTTANRGGRFSTDTDNGNNNAIPHWTPGRVSLHNWSVWTCLALGVIMVVVVIVVGYAIYGCYRSSAVVTVGGGGEEGGVAADGEISGERVMDGRARRNSGLGSGETKRHGIAIFCGKAKLLGRFKVRVIPLERNSAE
ncbi:hypothetical protein AX15_004086 [Amanita polypyramis BW_CC]|nr:hypothetical protein AX15_004086 [Amanita polypyramis BW_CC]